MRATALFVLVGCAGTAAPTTAVTTAAVAEPSPRLFAAGVGEAAVANPEEGSASYLSPIAVIEADGTRYLAVNGFDDDPGRRGIFLFEETAEVWSLADARIVTDLDLEAPGAIGSTLVRGRDGTWFLYGWGAPSGESDSSIVWLARASDLFGPWTVNPEPVLTKGGVGEWDDEGVLFPSVVATDQGFTMLYDGFGSVEGDHVGLAHSTDGVRWEKHNDPATDGVFEESDPVFGPDPEGDFDARSVQVGRLVATPDAWVMLYMGVPPGRGPSRIGIATSPDLINWDRRGMGLRETDIPVDNTGLHTIEGSYLDGMLEIFVEVLTERESTIWRATAPLAVVAG